MVSKSSYDEVVSSYHERGALLFEAVHLLNQAVRVSDADSVAEIEDQLDVLSQIEDFLSRCRLAGFA